MGMNKEVPAAVIADRKAFFNFMDFERLEQDAPQLLSQLRANAHLLEQQLGDGRPFLLGDRPGWADINGYFPVWMARTFIPVAAGLLQPFTQLARWEERVKAIGHGQRTELDAEQALDMARAATPTAGQGVDTGDPSGLSAGERVSVEPDDYGRVPVVGELVTLQMHEVAVRRDDLRVGTVVTHFPRIGYRVLRA